MDLTLDLSTNLRTNYQIWLMNGKNLIIFL